MHNQMRLTHTLPLALITHTTHGSCLIICIYQSYRVRYVHSHLPKAASRPSLVHMVPTHCAAPLQCSHMSEAARSGGPTGPHQTTRLATLYKCNNWPGSAQNSWHQQWLSYSARERMTERDTCTYTCTYLHECACAHIQTHARTRSGFKASTVSHSFCEETS